MLRVLNFECFFVEIEIRTGGAEKGRAMKHYTSRLFPNNSNQVDSDYRELLEFADRCRVQLWREKTQRMEEFELASKSKDDSESTCQIFQNVT